MAERPEQVDGHPYMLGFDYTADDGLVLVVRHIGAHGVLDAVGELIVPSERNLDTGIGDVTTVDIWSARAGGGEDGSLYKPVLGLLLVPIHGEAVSSAGK